VDVAIPLETLPGQEAQVDFGSVGKLYDPYEGRIRNAYVFVMVLSYSRHQFAKICFDQKVETWLRLHMESFEHFKGVPEIIVPDNLKSAVIRAAFSPSDSTTLNRSYRELARHYGFKIAPTPPRSPEKKGKVEVGVQVAQRWVLARLRNRVFHTLTALNAAIATCVSDLNQRCMRDYGQSRKELLDSMERPALLPLPTDPFEITEWKEARVNIDYHVAFGERLYSVPYRYVGEKVWICATSSTLEVQLRGRRIAVHARHGRGRYSTVPEHMPRAHREHAQWSPSRLLSWAQKLGAGTHALCSAILADRPHPEQGYRSCLGILRLAKKYGDERVENACTRCFSAHARSYRSVESVLKLNLDKQGVVEAQPSESVLQHDNIRGPDYFSK